MAGVEEDQIGGGGIVSGDVAGRSQGVHHPFGIVDVHLAAISLDEDFLQVPVRSVHKIKYLMPLDRPNCRKIEPPVCLILSAFWRR